MKTNELTGKALDWAVAKCEGVPVTSPDFNLRFINAYSYSTDWSQGGPIIEREGINLFQRKGIAKKGGRAWLAYNAAHLEQEGITPLIAAMRCYVASNLGDEVEIPGELTNIF